ncbi:T9SS type A sorting domain-containing protein, partial [Salibacteraceae bacterium]|nr:T9SS type A sorting domain-containing protein [Salibacteraceae bacterium]
NGDYDLAIWTLQAPNPIPVGDTVFINHSVTLMAELKVRDVLVINASGTVNGDNKLTNDAVGGAILNYGSIDIDKELHIDGSFFNYNYAKALKMHIDGYVCNLDTMEVAADKKIDLHGGELDCGGTVIACEVKFHDNGGTPSKLTSVNIDTCSLTCPSPPIFVVDPPGEDPTVDSNNTAVCNIVLATGIALPIELSYFDVFSEGDYVKVIWETLSEVENDHFILQRSENGYHWSDLATISGAGFSNEIIKYEHLDFKPLNGLSYYRLKQVDFNGRPDYSESISVSLNFDTEEIIRLFPSPARSILHVRGVNSDDQKISVFDSFGRDLTPQIDQTRTSKNEVSLNISQLHSGILILQVNDQALHFLKQ